MMIAKVTSVSPFTIQFAMDSTPSNRAYPRLATYSPNVGDDVIVLEQSGSYLVLGKVVV